METKEDLRIMGGERAKEDLRIMGSERASNRNERGRRLDAIVEATALGLAATA